VDPFTSQYLPFTPLCSQYLKSYLCPPIHPCVHSSVLLQFRYPGEGYLRVSQLSTALHTVTLLNRPLEVEEIFGWMKTTGGFRKTRFKGIRKTQMAAWLVGTAYNLLRIAKMLPE